MNDTHLSHAVNVDIILRLLRMRHKRLHQKIPQHTLHMLHLLHLVRSCLNPFSRFRPSGIELQQAGLASPLDQLIWLCDEFGSLLEEEWVCGFCGVEDTRDVIAVFEVDCGEFGGWVVR